MSQFEKNKKFKENRKKEFASVLRQLKQNWRGAHGSLTDEDLAEALDVSRESVNRWMNGSSYPSKSKLSALAEFFKVPVSFFSEKNDKPQGLTLIDEEAHRFLEEQCQRYAAQIGLSPAFVSFIKENPGLSDLIVSLCWVNPEAQSLDPSVPEVPGNAFQIVASSGVKVYPSQEVLQMLSLVQQDMIEAARFFIQRRGQVIEAYYRSGSGSDPGTQYTKDQRGMSGLSDVEAAMVEVFRRAPAHRKGERVKHFLDNVRKSGE